MNDARPRLLVAMREDLIFLIRHILEEAGYRVLTAHDLDRAGEIIKQESIALAILDRALLGDGARPSIRPSDLARLCHVPLLLVGGNHDSTNDSLGSLQPVECLEWPLSPDKLIARIRALLHNVRPDEQRTDRLEVGDIEVELQTYRIRRRGRRVDVGPLEFRLFCHLLNHSPRVFSRQGLIDAVWPGNVRVDPRTVDVHIGRLRRALNEGGAPDPIRTVRSAGYSLDFGDNRPCRVTVSHQASRHVATDNDVAGQ